MIRVGLMGHGTVGSGVAEILLGRPEWLKEQTGEDVALVKILDLLDFDVPYRDLFTKDADEMLDDESIDVIVECMGGIGQNDNTADPPLNFIRRTDQRLLGLKGLLRCPARPLAAGFDLRLRIPQVADRETHRPLHPVEIVVDTQPAPHKQRRRHPPQPQLRRKPRLEKILDRLDPLLRLLQGEEGMVGCG